jgi:hypothetical protein
MTLCPIALASSCAQCPAFKVCPLKSVLGDHQPEPKTAKPKPGGKKG